MADMKIEAGNGYVVVTPVPDGDAAAKVDPSVVDLKWDADQLGAFATYDWKNDPKLYATPVAPPEPNKPVPKCKEIDTGGATIKRENTCEIKPTLPAPFEGGFSAGHSVEAFMKMHPGTVVKPEFPGYVTNETGTVSASFTNYATHLGFGASGAFVVDPEQARALSLTLGPKLATDWMKLGIDLDLNKANGGGYEAYRAYFEAMFNKAAKPENQVGPEAKVEGSAKHSPAGATSERVAVTVTQALPGLPGVVFTGVGSWTFDKLPKGMSSLPDSPGQVPGVQVPTGALSSIRDLNVSATADLTKIWGDDWPALTLGGRVGESVNFFDNKSLIDSWAAWATWKPAGAENLEFKVEWAGAFGKDNSEVVRAGVTVTNPAGRAPLPEGPAGPWAGEAPKKP